jgi:hypothetical protein
VKSLVATAGSVGGKPPTEGVKEDRLWWAGRGERLPPLDFAYFPAVGRSRSDRGFFILKDSCGNAIMIIRRES